MYSSEKDIVLRARSHRRGALASLQLARELGKLLLEVRRLRGKRFRRLLQIGGVKLAQIPRHTLIDLRKAALHLRAGNFARVKFLSRLFTALNLLPSIATLAFVRRPICRQSATNWTQTLRIAGPLSLRKSAIV